MKIDLNELRKREKYINEQKHGSLDLIIWNYSKSCQFDNAWDEYTLIARGLITDFDGNIISRPFKKFFNINTFEGTKIEELPSEIPTIYEKLDGSLGITYPDGDSFAIATRGSFNSEQAVWATGWIKSKNFTINHDYTYLFEIIYPENRIVVDYGNRKELVLLAVIETETGKELDFIEIAKTLGLSYPKVINKNIVDVVENLKTLGDNEEGFVARYSDGFRVKMKGDEYVRLHRLITGFSNKSIWELLMNEQSFDEFLDRVPDEFFQWVKTTKTNLEIDFDLRWRDVLDAFSKLPSGSRKEQALFIMENFKKYSSAIFALLDGKDKEAKKVIWKTLKPKFCKPFKNDSEEV